MIQPANGRLIRSAAVAIASVVGVFLVVKPESYLAAQAAHYPIANSAETESPGARAGRGSELVPQGIARPTQRATMSAPLQGMLVQVLVRDGDEVAKDQILAVMDNRVVRASVEAARAKAECTAAIDHARHALALADSLLQRHTALHAAQAGADFELEQAQAERDQAAAMLAAARQSQVQATRNLELEEARLESHNVRAPFGGRVVRIHATPGTTVSPVDDLLTIVCLDSLQAEMHVPLECFGALRVGETYRLRAFAPINRPIHASLAFASPIVDPAANSFRCVFTIDNRDRSLPAGFSVCLIPYLPEPHPQDVP